MSISLDYPAILKNFGSYLDRSRTESRAFLAWFLDNFYRLEEIDVLDSIVDNNDDKGIDAIYVDKNLENIDVFQSKLFQNTKKTLGDTDLKEFAGTLSQIKSPEALRLLLSSTRNSDLKKLLENENVIELVKQGFLSTRQKPESAV